MDRAVFIISNCIMSPSRPTLYVKITPSTIYDLKVTEFVCLFVYPVGTCPHTHLGPVGTRLKHNAQPRLPVDIFDSTSKYRNIDVEIFLRFSTLFRRRNFDAISTSNRKCPLGSPKSLKLNFTHLLENL